MKKIILLLFVIARSPVVKDDICDANTVTTPRLVISFYDVTNSSGKKRNESNWWRKPMVVFSGSSLINGVVWFRWKQMQMQLPSVLS
jgi:hypothetical protein